MHHVDPTDPTTQDRMQRLLGRWNGAHDQRAVFLHCYALMTERILRRARK
jgi:hypothetical protein